MKTKLTLNKSKVSSLTMQSIKGRNRESIDDDTGHTNEPTKTCPTTNTCQTARNCDTLDCYTQNIDPNTICITGNN